MELFWIYFISVVKFFLLLAAIHNLLELIVMLVDVNGDGKSDSELARGVIHLKIKRCMSATTIAWTLFIMLVLSGGK